MTDQRSQQVVIINNSNLTMGPQIVFPSFRPISLYEIEDDYDSLISEIRSNYQEREFVDELIEFIDAFRDSLAVKNIEPLIQYFIVNHGGNFEIGQVQSVFQVLGEFINDATDDERLMN